MSDNDDSNVYFIGPDGEPELVAESDVKCKPKPDTRFIMRALLRRFVVWVLSSAAFIASVALIVSPCLGALHDNYPAVPALSYWDCFLAAVVIFELTILVGATVKAQDK